MNYLIFDTETTGLGAADEVIQFAAILTDSNFNLKRLFNFYCDTQQVISNGAFEVHHMDKKFLKLHSGGKTFEDHFLEVLKFLNNNGYNNVCWVAHNAKFDKRIINQTLELNGLKPFNFGKSLTMLKDTEGTSNFCTLEMAKALFPGKGGHKLEEMIKRLPYTKEQIDKSFALFANKCNLPEDLSYHNAIYDVYCDFLILKHFANRMRG